LQRSAAKDFELGANIICEPAIATLIIAFFLAIIGGIDGERGKKIIRRKKDL